MKSSIFKVLAVLLALMIATPASAQQILTKYGDDVGTLDGIIKAYYDVVSVKKGGKISYERDSLLHVHNVRVASAGVDAKGKPFLTYADLKEFHRQSDSYMEKTGFYEKETKRTVQNVRNLYHVWSSYESRVDPQGRVIAQGVNSIDLFYDGKRFWILGWFYD